MTLAPGESTGNMNRLVSSDEGVVSDQSLTTKLYEGVRKRKSKWVAEIKNPLKKGHRMWLGTYATAEEASLVYQSKKIELEEKVRVASEKMKMKMKKEKRYKPIIVCNETENDQQISETHKRKSEAAANEERENDQSLLVEQFSLVGIGNFLLKMGPVIVDNHGFVVGEFSWLDDLSIPNN